VITKLLLPAFLAILLPATPGMLEAKEPASPGILEFSCVAWDHLPCAELFYRQGNKFLPIKLSPGQRSQFYPLKDAEGRNILENRFFAQPTGRELVVISPPAEGQTEMSLKFLSDIIPASPTPRKKASSHP